MRQWPRGVRKDCIDLWLKDAAPSRPLLDAYNHAGLGWPEFEQRYRAEMLEQRPAVLDHLRQLEAEHGVPCCATNASRRACTATARCWWSC